MSLSKILTSPFRYRPWRPRNARLIGLDLVSGLEPEYAHLDHLRAAIDWLCLAQDVRDDKPDAGGVSAGWSFEDGWLPSYPETSGYIVETFLAAAQVLDRPDLIDAVLRVLAVRVDSRPRIHVAEHDRACLALLDRAGSLRALSPETAPAP